MTATVETKHFHLAERQVYELPREVAEIFLRKGEAEQAREGEHASKISFRN